MSEDIEDLDDFDDLDLKLQRAPALNRRQQQDSEEK